MREIWRLRFGPGKLRPDEYYYYGLYDDRRFTFADKLRFFGRATQNPIYKACNAPQWWFVAHDKLVFYAMLAGQRLPVPQTGRSTTGAAAAATVFPGLRMQAWDIAFTDRGPVLSRSTSAATSTCPSWPTAKA